MVDAQLRMRRLDAEKRFFDDIVGGVDEFLHARYLPVLRQPSLAADERSDPSCRLLQDRD
jgi:hypothetical protein